MSSETDITNIKAQVSEETDIVKDMVDDWVDGEKEMYEEGGEKELYPYEDMQDLDPQSADILEHINAEMAKAVEDTELSAPSIPLAHTVDKLMEEVVVEGNKLNAYLKPKVENKPKIRRDPPSYEPPPKKPKKQGNDKRLLWGI